MKTTVTDEKMQIEGGQCCCLFLVMLFVVFVVGLVTILNAIF